MTKSQKYQDSLDKAYAHAPFRLVEIIDFNHATLPQIPRECMVCGNKRLRYLCHCTGTDSTIWYIGRNCHTRLEEHYEEEQHKWK